MTRVGRATFFDDLATFPVSYVDEDLTVFRCGRSRGASWAGILQCVILQSLRHRRPYIDVAALGLPDEMFGC